jgi:hypothetical protein
MVIAVFGELQLLPVSFDDGDIGQSILDVSSRGLQSDRYTET